MYPRRNSEKNDSYYDDEDYLISRKMLGNDEAYGDDSYYDDEDYLDMADAVSSNDCTGLLTHGTGLEEELVTTVSFISSGQVLMSINLEQFYNYKHFIINLCCN